MGLAFATRNPTKEESTVLRMMLSTYRDGSGTERESDGSTRPGWRQMERCIAELLGSEGAEDKGIFDVIAPDQQNSKTNYGFSVKSKSLSQAQFKSLAKDGRVYMEIANSPALMWQQIQLAHRLTEQHYRDRKGAQKFGDTILGTVKAWHAAGKTLFEAENSGETLDLSRSCYLCLTLSKTEKPADRLYQFHAFPLSYPEGIQWKFRSDACLTGYDPAAPSEVLIDWYGLSGGQLKYYPRANQARYSTEPFTLLTPKTTRTLRQKAIEMFKDQLPKA